MLPLLDLLVRRVYIWALSGLERKCRDVLGKALLDFLVVSLR
jgi:hypothetical protein